MCTGYENLSQALWILKFHWALCTSTYLCAAFLFSVTSGGLWNTSTKGYFLFLLFIFFFSSVSILKWLPDKGQPSLAASLHRTAQHGCFPSGSLVESMYLYLRFCSKWHLPACTRLASCRPPGSPRLLCMSYKQSISIRKLGFQPAHLPAWPQSHLHSFLLVFNVNPTPLTLFRCKKAPVNHAFFFLF